MLRNRMWLRFWIPAVVLAVPQLWWLVGGDRPKDAFAWQSGWMSAQSATQTLAQNWTAFLGFWSQNAGLFLPLLFAVWLWAWLKKRNQRDAVLGVEHLKFYAPFFVMGFMVPNLFRLAPWVWDNTKVLLVWWIFSCPLVALFLAWLWNGARAKNTRRALTILAFAALTFSGAIDSWRGISSNSAPGTQNSETPIYGRAEMDVAQFLATLPSGGTVLSAPTYNTPASLVGKMAVMGYNGHLLSYGIDYNARESEVRDFLSGASDSESILEKYDVRYVVVGAMERDYLRTQNPPREIAPASFWTRWKEVGHIGEYSILETQAK